MKKIILISIFLGLLIPVISSAESGVGLLYDANGGQRVYRPEPRNSSRIPILQPSIISDTRQPQTAPEMY